MGPQMILERKIRELRRRIRLLNALHRASTLALYASLIGLVLLVASKFNWVTVFPEMLAIGIGGSALLGAFIGMLQRITPMETARRTDIRLGLKERLSSALEFIRSGQQHPLVELQIEDAAAHSDSIEPRKAYPLTCPREAKLFGITLAAILLLTFVPELPVFQSPKEKLERAELKNQGEEIVRVAKQTQKHATINKLDLAKRISRNMELLGRDMIQNRVSKKEAMKQMHKLTREMADAQKKLQTPEGRKSLDEALKDMKKAADNMPEDLKKTEVGKLMQQMAQAMEKKDFEKAEELAKKLIDKAASGQMSREQMKQASEQLKKMAEGLKGSPLGEMASKLQKAADAAAKGDMKEGADQIARAMQDAKNADRKMAESKQLQKMAEAVQASQQEMQGSSDDKMALQPGGG